MVGSGLFQSAIEGALDLYLVVDDELRIAYANPAARTVLGYRPADLVGTSKLALVHADDVDAARAALDELLGRPGGHATLQVRARHANGSWRDLEVAAHNELANDGVRGIILCGRDVTDHRRTLHELEEREQRFRSMAENAPDVIARYQVQPIRRTEYISPSVERITGYAPEEFYTKPDMHFRLVHPDDRPKLTRLATSGSIEDLRAPMTLRWIRKDGATIWMEQIIVPILDDDGELVATECVSRDVTDKVRLEEQLREAQKMDAIGRLAGGIAHDFNNLLGVVLGCADILRRRTPPDPRSRDALHAIIDATKRGATLTRQLLTFSHREIVEPEILDVNEVIEDVVPLLRRLIPENIDIRTVLDLDVGSVEIDQNQLEQVIINLAVHARDSMPDGGIITVETFTPGGDEPRVGLLVRDTGPGMDEGTRGRVFEPFFSSREASARNAGLGMAVVYGIVKHSGGAIECASALGHGTRFELTWPAVDPPRPEVPDALDTPASHAGTETVLVVEDEAALRLLIAQMLEESGFRVLQAEDAQTALRVSERHPDSIDLLLTDLVMPDINGRQLADRLSANQPRLRVLYMSGYADDEVVRQTVGLNLGAFLPKPFGIDELTDKIRRTLDGGRRR